MDKNWLNFRGLPHYNHFRSRQFRSPTCRFARLYAGGHTRTPNHTHTHTHTHTRIVFWFFFTYFSWWFSHHLRKCPSSVHSVSEAAMLNTSPYCECWVEIESNGRANDRRFVFLCNISLLWFFQTFLYKQIAIVFFYFSSLKIKYHNLDMIYL
jgi:hypothetical protein